MHLYTSRISGPLFSTGRKFVSQMLTGNILILNVRGFISRARQLVVRELVAQERFTLVALQETKLDTCDDSLILEMLGVGFYFFLVPATHTCGGILLAWHRDFWSATNPIFHSSSLTAKLHCNNADEQWWFTCVYGPQGENDKETKSMSLQCSYTSWISCVEGTSARIPPGLAAAPSWSHLQILEFKKTCLTCDIT
ncbi:hypothetical protein GQ55_5G181700 [Panicum hallii var. hallii]|nr:hypothetical protein GQ55_5G181700 [Panicum hallii var. hallii]